MPTKKIILIAAITLTIAILQSACRLKDQKASGLFVIASGGKPGAAILIKRDAPPSVKFAAVELKRHLGKITGGNFEIITSYGGHGRVIVLGDNEWSRKEGVNIESLARDGFVMKTTPGKMFIAGKDSSDEGGILFGIDDGKGRQELLKWMFERGTLNGVYALLEELGVRWFYPGPAGTIIPEKKEIVLNPGVKVCNPAFIMRTLTPHDWNQNVPIFLKEEYRDLTRNATNAVGAFAGEYRLWSLRMRDTGPIIACSHRPAWDRWVRRFAKDHPEYFAVLPDGSRNVKTDCELCYNSELVFDETLKDIEAYFAGDQSRGPNQYLSVNKDRIQKYKNSNHGWNVEVAFEDTYSLTPNDGYQLGACHCDKCIKQINDDAPFGKRHGKPVFDFVSRVGEALKGKYPDKKLVCLAYSSFTEVPEGLAKLPSNIVVGICPFEVNKTYNIVKKEKYEEYFRICRDWRKVSDQPFVFWVHFLWGGRDLQGVPFYVPHLMSKFIRDISGYGDKMFMEHSRDPIIMESLNRYITYKLLWEPGLDIDGLINDYLAKAYGPASAPIAQILGSVEAFSMKMNNEKTQASPCVADIWEQCYNPKTMKTYDELMEKALGLAKGTKHENQVRLFDKYYVGAIREGGENYANKMKELKELYVIRVKKAGMPIVIDGNNDEPAWENSNLYENFYTLLYTGPGALSKLGTKIRVLHSENKLFVLFVLDEKNLTRNPDDRVLIALDTTGDNKSYAYISIPRSGTNTLANLEKSGIVVAQKESNDTRIVEVSIPLKNTGKSIRGAIGRKTVAPPDASEERVSFSPYGGAGDPEFFATITFEE